MDDQLSVVYDSDKVRGYFNRTDAEFVPQTHMYTCENINFTDRGWENRPGTTQFLAANNVVHMQAYERINEVGRFIWLDSAGDFRDSVTGVTILSIATCDKFSLISLFNRAYITPHDMFTGLPSEKVYVYDPDLAATARAAAGLRATDGGAAFAAATAAAAGNVEVGTRLISYCFETDTGFRTKPIATPVVYTTSTASRKITLSNYDIGPAGTAKRIFLASKRIKNYDPLKKADYELFFIPGGVINDNTTTAAVDVNFFDADLVNSADYLNDLRETIPAGVFISYYAGRMVVGEPDGNTGYANVSKSGDPESFSEVDGFIIAYPGEGENLTNGREYRGQFLMTKISRTLVTQDNGLEPNSWQVTILDAAIGSTPWGISKVGSSLATTRDTLLIFDLGGIWVFNGAYPVQPLTWAIDGFWELIDRSDRSPQLLVDARNNKLYINLMGGGGGIGPTLLVGDFEYGLDPENIRWSLWQFPLFWTLAAIEITGEVNPTIYVAVPFRDKILSFSSAAFSDDGSNITAIIQPAPVRFDEDSEWYHYAALRFRFYDPTSAPITIQAGIADFETGVVEQRNVTSSSIFKWARELYNTITSLASAKFSFTSSTQRLVISKAILYGTVQDNESER